MKPSASIAVSLPLIGFIAYNGISAEKDIVLHPKEDFSRVVLLKESFRPYVNMSREEIIGFPIETQCCLAMIGIKHPVLLLRDYELTTRRDLEQILDKHPSWHQKLKERYPVIYGYSKKGDLLEILNEVSMAMRVKQRLVDSRAWVDAQIDMSRWIFLHVCF